ncbi:DUF1648 domain-containing protein [Pantanalinema rosaneae CENA516]|uniref:DUF1648 domain-containing protein n=1 Tax=Pantanalinema rosaneae TaxID=1620701 RepID=UPI003D6E0D18
MKAPIYAIVGLVVLVALQTLWFYPQLPDPIASHFNAIGQPDGWAPKPFFFLIYAGVVALDTWLVWGLPQWIERRPDSQINLPHKDYWLASDRRPATFAFIQQQMGWFGVANLLLMVYVFQLVISANLNPPPQLPMIPIWTALGIYLLYTIVWLISFYQRFRRPT